MPAPSSAPHSPQEVPDTRFGFLLSKKCALAQKEAAHPITIFAIECSASALMLLDYTELFVKLQVVIETSLIPPVYHNVRIYFP
jgi:hypothetical protein